MSGIPCQPRMYFRGRGRTRLRDKLIPYVTDPNISPLVQDNRWETGRVHLVADWWDLDSATFPYRRWEAYCNAR